MTIPGAVERPSSRWRWIALGAVILVTAVLRVWVILHHPEPDGDAQGHLGIATALLSDPLNVAVHWVWPPGYHYFLAALLAVGVTAQGVRLLNCALAALLPSSCWSLRRAHDRAVREQPRAPRPLPGRACSAPRCPS